MIGGIMICEEIRRDVGLANSYVTHVIMNSLVNIGEDNWIFYHILHGWGKALFGMQWVFVV